MEKYILDSSAIIDLVDANKTGIVIQKSIENSELKTSIICYCEVLNKLEINKQEATKEILSRFVILPISIEDGMKARKIQYECRKMGKQISTMDALIAATALNKDLTLITCDSDFDRIASLKKQIF